MKNNIWKKLEEKAKLQGRPFLVLAPMAEVTDSVFRQIVAKCAKPDVFFTEMISCEGLVRGNKRTYQYLQFLNIEKPLIVQLFGSNPESFRKASKIVSELGFSGIDINMGCPQPKIIKNGAGSALIKNPKLAREIIRACKDGAGGLPVSVKTRLGFDIIETEHWISEILLEFPEAITIHARTKKEMFREGIHVEEISKIVEMAEKTGVVVIGNGDVKSLNDAQLMFENTGVSGVMIGRAALGNPWVFNQKKMIEDGTYSVGKEEKIAMFKEHTQLFRETWKNEKNFFHLKKYVRSYIFGFDSAKEMRVGLMEAENYDQFLEILEDNK